MMEPYDAERDPPPSVHWRANYVRKTVLDFGADYGSTAQFFILEGACKVIAVERDPKQFEQLLKNAEGNQNMRCIAKDVQSGQDFQDILALEPVDICKVDIEHAERFLTDVPDKVLEQIPLYLIETHSPEILASLTILFNRLGYKLEIERLPAANCSVLRATRP